MTAAEFDALFELEKASAAAKRNALRARERDDRIKDLRLVEATLTKLNNAKRGYDGVTGLPPEWLPEPLKHEFRNARRRLLFGPPNPDEAPLWKRVLRARRDIRGLRKTHEIIGRLSDDAASIAPPGTQPGARRVAGLPFVDPYVSRDLEALIYIHDLAQLGSRAGMRAYLGKGPEEVLRGIYRADQNRLSARRPRPSHLTRAIKAKLMDDPSATWEVIHRALPRALTDGLSATAFANRVLRARKSLSLAG